MRSFTLNKNYFKVKVLHTQEISHRKSLSYNITYTKTYFRLLLMLKFLDCLMLIFQTA